MSTNENSLSSTENNMFSNEKNMFKSEETSQFRTGAGSEANCMRAIMTVLYIENLEASKKFYTILLNKEPILDEPGMVEFQLLENVTLGLMPLKGIVKLLGMAVRHRAGDYPPCCELYMTHDDPEICLVRLDAAGGKLVQPLKVMDWGDEVAYGLDPDGHVLGFARPLKA
ncbi:MAG: hypothetical protein Q7I98_06855 [Erysipelotrichaceae bacterium]|nr:hypothetical protein [Erysipelotrichaceae bacterium]